MSSIKEYSDVILNGGKTKDVLVRRLKNLWIIRDTLEEELTSTNKNICELIDTLENMGIEPDNMDDV